MDCLLFHQSNHVTAQGHFETVYECNVQDSWCERAREKLETAHCL